MHIPVIKYIIIVKWIGHRGYSTGHGSICIDKVYLQVSLDNLNSLSI